MAPDGHPVTRRLRAVGLGAPGRSRLLAALLATGAGALVLLLAVELFPYTSVNHDEGVYLQQAELLLSGRLDMVPAQPGAVRPWFFVREGGQLYPRYAPVPAAIFALGELAGGSRLSLGAVAAGNVALTYALASAAYDRRAGLLAAALLAVTPAFLFTSAVFLPYAPTTLLNLTFAVAYVRSVRREGRTAVGWGLFAGVAVGLAGFARPYTAVLFAAPFVAHSLWRLARAGRRALRDPTTATPGPEPLATVARLSAVAVPALALVGVALWYNALLTGSPWRFPFQVLAPTDGLGFGRHRVLDHAIDYTPRLALRSNAVLLWEFATRWTVAPPLGTLLALAGVGRLLAGRDTGSLRDRIAVERLDGVGVRLLLLAVVVSVVLGNVYFWGTYNVLGDLADPGDGFMGGFGPFYHFDTLPVLATFGAAGALAGWDWLRTRAPSGHGARRVTLAAVLALALVAGGAAQVVALDGPYADHAAYTDRYEETYAPLEDRSFDRALVFVPSAYGPWLNHPFQSLRNEVGPDGRLAGEVVYARDRPPAGDFAVLETHPDRRPYRFTYRGEWTPDPADRVAPKVVPLSVRSGPAATVRTTVAVPDGATSVSARLTVDDESVDRAVGLATEDAPDQVTLVWRLTPGAARVEALSVGDRRLAVNGTVPLEGPREVAATLTFSTPGGATVTYREELDARPNDGAVQVIWPPERSVCTLVTDCGLEGTYLPDRPDPRVPDTRMASTLVVESPERENESESDGG